MLYFSDLSDQFSAVKVDSPQLFDRGGAEFLRWLEATCEREATSGHKLRFYHNAAHVTAMQDQSSAWEQGQYAKLEKTIAAVYTPLTPKEASELKRLARLAAPGHDQEYHVDGSMTSAAANLSDYKFHWVTTTDGYEVTIPTDFPPRRQGVSFREDDQVALMVMEVFDKKAGDKLSSLNGQNEFLSALSWARRMEAAGESFDAIVGVTAIIAATMPFKLPKDYNALRDRLDKVYENPAYQKKLKSKDSPDYSDETARHRRVDALMGTATIFANKDVLGFVGSTEQAQAILDNPDLKPSEANVLFSHQIGNRIMLEESPAQVKKATKANYGRGYKAQDLITPALKIVRLTDRVLAGDFTKRTRNGTEKLFHETQIGRGDMKVAFPPSGEIERFNEFAMSSAPGKPVGEAYAGVNDIARLAKAAQAGSFAVIHALQNLDATNRITTADLASLTGKMTPLSLNLRPEGVLPDESAEEKQARLIANNVLLDRSDKLTSDLIPCTLAAALVDKLPAKSIMALYEATEQAFGKNPDLIKRAHFLETATDIVGRDNMGKIVSAMAKSLEASGEKGLAEDLRTNHRSRQI